MSAWFGKRSRLGAFCAAALALAVAPPASAKGPVSLHLCGAEQCRTFTWRPVGRPAHQANKALVLGIVNLEARFRFAAAPPPAPYYEVRLGPDWLPASASFYVPSHSVARVGSNWMPLGAELATALARASRGLAPRPGPAITGVSVAGEEVSEPAAYARLLGRLPSAGGSSSPAAVDIVVRSAGPTPWTDGRWPIRFFPADDVLRRGNEWLAVPPELARRIERDAGLRAPTPRAAASSARVDVVAPLAVVGAVGLLGLTLTRRRSRGRAS